MKYAIRVGRLHVVNAWFQESDQRRILARQPDLPALAEDRESIPIAPQCFQQGQRIGNQFAVLMLPVEECEREREHQRTDKIERIRGADGNVELAAGRRTEQLQQMLSLVRPKHRMPPDRRKYLRAIAGL